MGWLDEPALCWAAGFGNKAIVDRFADECDIDSPFLRAAMGDLSHLEAWAAARNDPATATDESGFNLLFYCAKSRQGIDDEASRTSLEAVAQWLLDHGVDPGHTLERELPISAPFLCASSGINLGVMTALLTASAVTNQDFQLVIQHTLEPHQRSGEPAYAIADAVLAHGLDINAINPKQRRTRLHGSANRGTLKAVQWLLDNGADPYALDESGPTW